MLNGCFLSSQGPAPFTDLLNLNSAPPAAASLLVDVLMDSSTPAPAVVSEDNFSRWEPKGNWLDE